MRFGLCSALRRLWIRLVMNTVLPERLSPVTASHTVAPPDNSPKVLTRRSEACAKTGGSQLRFTVGGIICASRASPPEMGAGRRPRKYGHDRAPSS
jgi:hypothetical protein